MTEEYNGYWRYSSPEERYDPIKVRKLDLENWKQFAANMTPLYAELERLDENGVCYAGCILGAFRHAMGNPLNLDNNGHFTLMEAQHFGFNYETILKIENVSDWHVGQGHSWDDIWPDVERLIKVT